MCTQLYAYRLACRFATHPSTCTDHEPRKAERRPGLVTREWLHGAQLYGCLPLLSSMVEHMHMYMYMYTYMLYM